MGTSRCPGVRRLYLPYSDADPEVTGPNGASVTPYLLQAADVVVVGLDGGGGGGEIEMAYKAINRLNIAIWILSSTRLALTSYSNLAS
jgi:hypothetical protein